MIAHFLVFGIFDINLTSFDQGLFQCMSYGSPRLIANSDNVALGLSFSGKPSNYIILLLCNMITCGHVCKLLLQLFDVLESKNTTLYIATLKEVIRSLVTQ